MLLRSVAVAAALAVAAVPGWAASTASVQVSSLQLRLVDLDTSDGITPSISFVGGVSRGSASASFTTPGSSGSENVAFNGLFTAWEPGSAHASNSYSTASAVLAGSGTAAGSTLTASGSATAPGGGFCLPGSDGYNTCFTSSAGFGASVTPGDYSGQFVLSANTLLVLTANVSLSASATGGGRVDFYSWFQQIYSDHATAGVTLEVNGLGPLGHGWQSASDNRGVYANAFYDHVMGQFVPSSEAFSGAIAVSFTNLTGSDMVGSYRMNLNSGGHTYADALLVPEPGSWALMLAGLAAVAGAARRRRQERR